MMTLETPAKFDAAIGPVKPIHKFEAAGLGKAPFRFTGISENIFVATPGATPRAGGSCDYCLASIMNEFHVTSADGKTFKVGCDCINKVGDEGLAKQYKTSAAFRAFKRAKEDSKAALILTELKSLIEANKEKLKAMPHPRGFTDRKTGAALTNLDQVEWLFNNSGRTGRASMLRALKSELH